MSKFDKAQIIKNVSSSWLSLAVNIAVGIFLSPFILHRLGDAAFGIWVLVFSTTGYYGLFELGIRSSIVRYVSKFAATRDQEGMARLINTSLCGYLTVALLCMVATVAISLNVSHIFHIPADLLANARWLFFMVGSSVALGFPLGLFGGFLEGLQRFDVTNSTNIIGTLLRAVLIIVVMNHGYGLLMVAFITVALPLLSGVVRAVIALRIFPVPFGLHYVNKGTFKQIASYSAVTVMIAVAGRLKFKTDEIVIGTFLSAAAITYFNIGARIVDYAREVVTSLAQIFVPMSSHSEATDDMDRLRKIFVGGNRVCAFVCFPITAVLIILGPSVIEAWVGKKYIATSYPVLLIMIIPFAIWQAQAASGRVLFGMSKHGTWAIVTFIEGIANLILSIILVRPYGIIGDALGTAIPLMCSMTLFMPWHLCKLLSVKMGTYLREAYTLPLLLTLPMMATILLMKAWFVPHGYKQLLFHLLIAGTVYGLGLAWAFWSNKALKIGRLVPLSPVSASAASD